MKQEDTYCNQPLNIEHTYKVYQKQKDNLRRTNGWGKPVVLIQFKKQHKAFSENDIEMLDTYLRQEKTKWFVADLFNVLERFPESLLKVMLQTAVNEPDPSFNNAFIQPCRRIYGYEETHSILMEIFNAGNDQIKIGVLKALYWARQTVYSYESHFDNKVEIQFGYDTFVWNNNEKYYDEEFVDDKSLFDTQGKMQNDIRNKEILLLIDVFNNTENINLKYLIGLRLPKELNAYPADTKEQAAKYLLRKHSERIPQNLAELEAFKKVKGSS